MDDANDSPMLSTRQQGGRSPSTGFLCSQVLAPTTTTVNHGSAASAKLRMIPNLLAGWA